MDPRTTARRTALMPPPPARCLLLVLPLLAATASASSSVAHSSSRSSAAAFAVAPHRLSPPCRSGRATLIHPSPSLSRSSSSNGQRRGPTPLYYLNKDDPNSSSTDVRTDVKSYLTQRSIQSLLYLLTTINDGTTASWLENEFLQPDDDEPNNHNKKSSIVDYHGTGAAYLVDKGGWREIFLSLIDTPPVTKRISLGKKFTGGGGKPIQDSYLNKLSGGSSEDQSGATKSESAGGKGAPPPKSYNPFGGPIVSGSETTKGGGDAAAPASSGRRTGGMGFGGSYLDSIGSNSGGSAPTSQNDVEEAPKKTLGGGVGARNKKEAFHRSLLEARLEMERLAHLDVLEARLKKQAEQAKQERLHRSLLARRFGGDVLVNDAVAAAAHGKTEKEKKGETTNENLIQEGGSGEFSHREEALRRSLLASRLLAQRKGARALDEQRDIAKALKARRDELMAEKRLQHDGDRQQEKKNGRDDSDDNVKSKKKQAGTAKDSGTIDRQRLAADRDKSMSTNPHVRSDDDEYYMDLTIDPLSVAQRLLAVRAQMALEFVEDLTLIYQADVQWLAKQDQPPPSPEADDGASSLANKRQGDRQGKSASSSARSIATTFASISYPKKDDNDKSDDENDTEAAEAAAATPPSPLYERAAVRMHHEKLSYSSKGHSSSPFRRSNFDLLYNLATQASVHRLLRRLMAPVDDDDDDEDDLLSSDTEEDDEGDEESQPFFAKAVPADKNKVSLHRQASFEWLREFYVSRVSSYFDGHVPYGRADDFVEEWLRQVPVRVADTDNNRSNEDAMPYSSPSTSGLDHVNPRKLMKEMMKMRCEIAMEWRKSMRADTENDHGFLRLVMMEKRVANQSSPEINDNDNDGGGGDGMDMEGFQ